MVIHNSGSDWQPTEFVMDASATLMNFRRKSQNISVYKTNNIGNDLRQDVGASVTSNSAFGTGILSRILQTSMTDMSILIIRRAYQSINFSN